MPRAVLRSAAGRCVPWVILAVWAASASERPEFNPPPNRAGQSAWIALRHQRQEQNWCVPTSASIILDYFGDAVSPREIKTLSQRGLEGGAPDHSITLFRDLIAGLARRGYEWREKTYANDGGGFHRGLADIERSLDGRVPVMIDTTVPAGHTVVIAGYSAPARVLYAIDPNRPAPGIRAIGFGELEGIWNSRAVGFNGRAAVFPRRGAGRR